MEPNGPGLPVGPQQFTGRPAIGSGLFCWLSDCILRDRLLKKCPPLLIQRHRNRIGEILPSSGEENDDSNNNRATDSCAGCNCDFVHVRCCRGKCSHLAALGVWNVLWGDVGLFQRNHANDDALLRGNVFDFEFTFAGLQRGSLFETLVSEEAIDDAKAQDVGGVRVPLDDDGIVLAVSVLHLNFMGIVNAT